MCQCGCSEGGPDYRFRGPDQYWYGIRIYSGCRDCDAPAGVDVFKMDPDDYRMMNCKALPLLDFKHGMESLAVIDARRLMDELKKEGIEVDEDAFGEGDYSDIIRSAVSETTQHYEREREKTAKKPKQPRRTGGGE